MESKDTATEIESIVDPRSQRKAKSNRTWIEKGLVLVVKIDDVGKLSLMNKRYRAIMPRRKLDKKNELLPHQKNL